MAKDDGDDTTKKMRRRNRNKTPLSKTESGKERKQEI